MEKTCEFCGRPRPVVYCEADAARLCLACDSKVHSANALFGRHSRTLLCDSCTDKPACVRCLDHLMLLCQDCEPRLHQVYSQHKKLSIGSFTGCPAAKHFAALWGFDVNDELHQFSQNELNSCREQQKKISNHQEEQHKSLILHQILELKNLQLIEGHNQSSSFHNHEEYVTSEIMLNKSQGQGCKEQPNCLSNELQSLDNPSQMLKGERFPISQLDHFSSSSAAGDPFWQCNKSALENNQYWSQNLQDLGRCQELGCFDDFNIPDVDATFTNFEDLLIDDPDLTRSLLEDNDPIMCSDFERSSMMETSQEIAFASSSVSTNKHVNPLDHVTRGLYRSEESSPHPFKYARSATFLCSQFSAESSSTEYIDSANSGNGIDVEGKEGSMRISNGKKKTPLHRKKTQIAPHKTKADMQKKLKSWCGKAQGYESDTATVTKSY